MMIENAKALKFGFTVKNLSGQTGFQISESNGNKEVARCIKKMMPSIAQKAQSTQRSKEGNGSSSDDSTSSDDIPDLHSNFLRTTTSISVIYF